MATKNISTRISLVGEQEWRRAVDACKATLAEYKSELSLVNTIYKNTGNTLDALTAKETAQKKITDQLVKTQELYKQRAEDLRKALEAQKEQSAGYQQVVDMLNKALEDEAKAHGKNTDYYKATTEALKIAKNELGASTEAEKNWSAELARTNTQIATQERQIIESDNAVQGYRKRIEELQDPLQKTRLYLADVSDEVKLAATVLQQYINKAYGELVQVLKESTEASINFEAELTRVRKTTNMSVADVTELGEALKTLSTQVPITTSELTKIAETAGQLGIANDDILEFTDTMARMSASTNMSAEQAATNLAQIAAVTGMSASEYSRLASSIVAVGNNFATTESQVAYFVQRIAGAATNVNMTESEMVGLATAISSLGIASDAGSTAMQSLINKIETAVATGKNLDAWASVMKMSTEDLAVLWRTNATSALTTLIQNLGNLDESMTTTLSTLGISEQRIIRTVSTLANAEHSTGLLTRALDTANEAWMSNTALMTESQTQFETTQSKVEMFENAINNLKIAVGDELNPVIGLLADTGNNAVTVMTEFVQEHPQVVTAITAITAALGALAAMATYNIADAVGIIKTLTTAITGLNLPLTLLVSAVAAAGAALLVTASRTDTYVKASKKLVAQTKETVEATEEHIDAINKDNDALVAQVGVMSELLTKHGRTVEETELLNSVINDLNKAVPDLNIGLSETGNSLVNMSNGAAVSVKNVNSLAQAMAKQAIEEEKIASLKQLYIDKIKYEEQLTQQKKLLLAAEREYLSLLTKDVAKADAYELGTLNDLRASVRELEEGYALVTDKIDEYSDVETKASDVTNETIRTMEKQAAALLNQKQAFSDAKDAIVSHMDDVVGSFDKVSKASTMSYWTMMKNLQSQIDYMNTYTENLDSLMGRNINGVKEFAKQFSDGTRESAEALASFAKMSDEQVSNIIALYNKVPPTMDAWSTGLAKVQTSTHMTIEDMIKEYNRLQRAIKDARAYAVYFGSNRSDQEIFNLIMSGGHAQGLEYVPYDDYAAMLHEGEMVLTRAEARAYRQEHTTGQSITNNTRNFGGVTLNVYSRQGQNIDELADEIMYRIEDATKRKEAVWA